MANETQGGSREIDIKAIDMIRTSDVLNPSATLDKIMALTQRLAAIQSTNGAAATKVKATFMGSWFVYTTEQD